MNNKYGTMCFQYNILYLIKSSKKSVTHTYTRHIDMCDVAKNVLSILLSFLFPGHGHLGLFSA